MELSEEEKKAIERLKLFEYRYVLVQNDDEVVKTIASLIEKQQNEIKHQKQQKKYWRDNFYKQRKEIEELKDINKKLEARKYMFNTITGEVKAIPIDNNYISKDKIREKIKNISKKAFNNEINYSDYYYKTEILNELLEEN